MQERQLDVTVLADLVIITLLWLKSPRNSLFEPHLNHKLIDDHTTSPLRATTAALTHRRIQSATTDDQFTMIPNTAKAFTRATLPRSRAYLATRRLQTTSRQNDKDPAFDPQTTKPEEQKERAAEELTHEQPVSNIRTVHQAAVVLSSLLS